MPRPSTYVRNQGRERALPSARTFAGGSRRGDRSADGISEIRAIESLGPVISISDGSLTATTPLAIAQAVPGTRLPLDTMATSPTGTPASTAI